MKFIENQSYHVYNQGNNRRKVFFTEADYEHFLYKIISYVTPFADIIAYCIMPNHYHLLIYVNKVSIDRGKFRNEIESIQKQYLKERKMMGRLRATRLDIRNPRAFSLEESFGIIQRSYSRYINLKKGWTGSVFRNNYKVKDGWSDQLLGVNNSKFTNNSEYLGKCIEYIHQNPVKANLCNEVDEWQFSSAVEHLGSKGKGICSLKQISGA